MDLRFFRSLVIAAVLHLSVGALMVTLARWAGVDVQAAVQTLLAPSPTVEVELLETPAPIAVAAPRAPESSTAGQLPHPDREPLAKVVPSPPAKHDPSPTTSGIDGTPGGGQAGMAGGGLEGEGDGQPEGAGESGGDGARPRGPAAIGLNRDMTWMWVDPKAVERPPTPAPASTSGGLHEALDAHDRKRGLGFGGPVVAVMHAAALGTRAPVTGDAVFEASFDASGRVQSVHVLSVGGNMAEWQRLAQDVRRMLGGRRLRVPPASRGVAITVQVVARYQMPSGSAPGESVQIQGAGAQFDLSDIGASPARNVSVRILSERRL